MGTHEEEERDKREADTEKRILRQWRKRIFLPSKDQEDFPDPESNTRH